MDYGTGAIMSVPAHDERDYEFAKKYGLDIRVVILPRREHAPARDSRPHLLNRVMRKRADAQGSGVFAAQGDLPAREMLADMLLGTKRPEEALREYDAQLKISPKRFDSLYGAGEAAEIMNKPEKAASYYRQLLEGCENGNSTRPELARAREVISTVPQK